MSVQPQQPIVTRIANGSTTEFDITFDLHDEKALVVTVNNEIPEVGSFSVRDNKVIFGVAPTEGSIVILYRDSELNRLTDYKNYDGSFNANTINWDLDKLWYVLQEQNLVDAKILARIKEEIEWRRTHDFNYDMLGQVREKQLFDALKGYTDTLLASTNPGVFQGVIAGVVFARDGKSIQTHLEEILDTLAQERENIDLKAEKHYVDEQLDLKAPQATTYTKTEVDSALSLKAPQETTYTKAEVDTTFAAYVGGRKGFTTLALAQADQANLPANTTIEVTNDGANNGTYQWNGTTLTKSVYDPLTQAKNYADENAIFNPKPVSSTLGVDLNNLNTFGFHKIVSQNAWGATLNKPKDLTGPWAFVLVLPVSSTAFFQLFYSLNDKKIAYRVRTTATVISEWVFLSGDSVVLQSAIEAANSLISDSLVQFKDDDLPLLIEDMLQPKFDIVSKNIFDSSKIITGKTISSNGALVDRANGVITGVLDVKNQGYITVSGLQPSIAYRAIVFKDANNDVLNVTSIAANLTQKSFPVPAGAVTAQMTLKENSDTFTLDTSTIQFEFNTTPTTYEPYRRGALNSLFGSTIKNEQAETEIGVRSRAFGASYLLFGDSITETSNVDAGLFDQTSYRKNWPTWAVETLQMGTFRNYAKSGAAFKDRSLEPRYQYLYNQVVDAIANNENPDVIVVACGTNDGMGNVGTYETAMSKASLEDLDQLKTLEAARWVFWKLRLQYPDAVCFYANPLQRMANTTEELAPLVDGLGKIAQRHGFILIDQHRESGIIRELEVLSGSGKYLADGLHPNDLGRQRQANLIVSKIVSYMSY